MVATVLIMWSIFWRVGRDAGGLEGWVVSGVSEGGVAQKSKGPCTQPYKNGVPR